MLVQVALMGGFAVTVDGVPVPPERWARRRAALAGHWRQAAAEWNALGERYEEALELVGSHDATARAAGIATLTDLGADAVLARVRRREG